MSLSASAHSLLAVRPGPRVSLDAAVAVAALAATLAQLSHSGPVFAHPVPENLDPANVLLAACSALPLLAWRRFPLGVFMTTATASVLLAALGQPIDLLVGPAAALCLLAASRDRDTPWTWRSTAMVLGVFVLYLGATAAVQGDYPGSELLHSGLAWAAAWFAGERARLRREQVAEFKDRALRTEREAERERLLAVAEERARIARDLHDSAGHAISVIAVRAGAARLRHRRDPERSRLALEEIEELARETAEEIDQIVGTLRRGGAASTAVEPPHGLASLGTLIARHEAAGLAVTYDADGTPRPLAGATDQAAHRILQEALRNAARHGTGRAGIRLSFDDDAVELTVTNPVNAGGVPRPGGGHGLIGMRERATLLGGTLDTDRTKSEFRLRARLPYGTHGGRGQ